MEWEASANWPGGVDGHLSYALQRSRNTVQEMALPNSPKSLLQARLRWAGWKKHLSVSADGMYMSRRETLNNESVGGFAVVNATVMASRLGHYFDLALTARNLLDKRYADPVGPEIPQGWVAQNGRTISLRLGCSF